MLLPVLFVIVAVLFATAAQRVGREMAVLPPLTGYTANVAGSLLGVAAFALLSWLELPPVVWFGVAFVSALPLITTAEPDGRGRAPGLAWIGLAIVMLGASLDLIHLMGRDATGRRTTRSRSASRVMSRWSR